MRLTREQWRLVQRMADAAMEVLHREASASLESKTAIEDAIYDAVASSIEAGGIQTEDDG